MKLGPEPAQITPTLGGWRLHVGSAAPREVATLEEIAALLPPGGPLELSLPCHSAVLERLTLPSPDREELLGMLQLHLEKTLPYPVEEVTSDFEQIRQSETESTILALAVHGPVLAQLCQPLRDAERLPDRVSLFALDIAAHCPDVPTVAAVWVEQGNIAIAIYERGKLSWASNLLGMDAETLRNELPSLLLTAEVDGVPTAVDAVVVASDCPNFHDPLHQIFGVPIGAFAIEKVRPRPGVNLLPPDWAAAAVKQEKTERLRQRLLLGAVVYLILVACAFVYLAWTKRQVQMLDLELARTQPSIQKIQETQSRWEALAPALDRRRYTVEMLQLVYQNRKDVHITLFDTTPDRFIVEGEAGNPQQAVDFAENMRADKDLAGVEIVNPQPNVLPNGHAQFHIEGKL